MWVVCNVCQSDYKRVHIQGELAARLSHSDGKWSNYCRIPILLKLFTIIHLMTMSNPTSGVNFQLGYLFVNSQTRRAKLELNQQTM